MKLPAWVFAAILLLTGAGTLMADESPTPAPAPVPTTPRTTTVGGGVANPWRPPYKTAAAPAPAKQEAAY